MADAGGGGRFRAVAELLFVRRPWQPVRLIAVLLVIAGCFAFGAAALDIQAHFAAHPSAGRWETFLARGSSALTACTGWAAAAFFLIALLRLRRGTPEPPAGRTPVEELSATQLRAGLVREYIVVRICLCVLVVITLVDAARGARYAIAAISGDGTARGSLVATLIEAAGFVVATAVLSLWALSFRRQLVRMGALSI
jgi:hypothetical protein